MFLHKVFIIPGNACSPPGSLGLGLCSAEDAYVTSPHKNPGCRVSRELTSRQCFARAATSRAGRHWAWVTPKERIPGRLCGSPRAPPHPTHGPMHLPPFVGIVSFPCNQSEPWLWASAESYESSGESLKVGWSGTPTQQRGTITLQRGKWAGEGRRAAVICMTSTQAGSTQSWRGCSRWGTSRETEGGRGRNGRTTTRGCGHSNRRVTGSQKGPEAQARRSHPHLIRPNQKGSLVHNPRTRVTALSTLPFKIWVDRVRAALHLYGMRPFHQKAFLFPHMISAQAPGKEAGAPKLSAPHTSVRATEQSGAYGSGL